MDKPQVFEDNFGPDIVVTAQRPKRFDLNSFKSEINKNQTLSNHSYLISFSPFKLAELNSIFKNVEDSLMLRCESATLPGVNMLKDENIRRYGYGPVETVPYGVQYNMLRLSWILDRNSKIMQFFNEWHNSIVNSNSKGGADMLTKNSRNYSPYEVGYKDDYSSRKLTIFIYDNKNDTVIEYELFDVFPAFIEDINMSWSDQNNLIKYNVQFSFTDANINTPQNAEIVNPEIINIFNTTQNMPRGYAPANPFDSSYVIT